MKINWVFAFIAFAISVLLGYGVYTVAGDDPNKDFAFIYSVISFLIALVPGIAITSEESRKDVSIRVLSFAFLLGMLLSHFLFASWGIRMNSYIIVNGLIDVIFLGCFYGINRTSII